MKQSKRIVVIGAAGQIAYALLPMIAKGEALGPNEKVTLVLYDIPVCENIMKGIVVELEDIVSSVLEEAVVEINIENALKDADIVFALAAAAAVPLKGSRSDTLHANKNIYESFGKTLNEVAKKTCKVIVISNPTNTLTLTLMKNAPSIPPQNFFGLNRSDHNRCISHVARKLGISPSKVHNAIVWGNHSSTMVPDFLHIMVEIDGKIRKAIDVIKDKDFWATFIKDIRQRGYKIYELRQKSAGFSIATASVNLVHDLFLGTPEGKFVSMVVYSDGSYDVPKDIYFGMPCSCKNGEYAIVKDLDMTFATKDMLIKSVQELIEEKKNAGL